MDKRLMLPHVGSIITFQGTYAGYRHIINPEKSGKERVNKVAIVERIDAWIDERWQMVGHSHIQRADAILELKPRLGDKLEFSCEVFEYPKKNAQGEAYTGIGLGNPDKVSLIQATPAPVTPPPAPAATPVSTPAPAPPVAAAAPALTVLRRIKEIGTESLKRCLQLQAEIGNDTLQKSLQLQSEIGNDTLAELIELLS